MDVDGPEELWARLDKLEADARGGDRRARMVLVLVIEALDLLRGLQEPPSLAAETPDLKFVRQSRRYQLWRVSHPFNPELAIRLICWFPPDASAVVVALFFGDKAKIGDVWYDSVASRADRLIDQYKREKAEGS